MQRKKWKEEIILLCFTIEVIVLVCDRGGLISCLGVVVPGVGTRSPLCFVVTALVLEIVEIDGGGILPLLSSDCIE
ncbi:unnamed protein product [Rotaria sp. Silwood1]|nr:unnamed protein product [Rotaria sp. Silwood1]